ncbi:MAG: CoA-binding protein [Bacteroidetes bacterium]|jgi:predicted CoA-binding protein|nr:CoA-binding protein [Bacteroidota bacterium]
MPSPSSPPSTSARRGPALDDPHVIQRILRTASTIAIVGLSNKTQRASHFVGSYLQDEGYRIIPVNPTVDAVLGEPAYPDLASIPDDITVDVVDVFRRPTAVPAIVAAAIAREVPAVWMQFGVVNGEAARDAQRAGLDAIMDRCMKIEHGRYTGGLHWMGMNTGVISAKRQAW